MPGWMKHKLESRLLGEIPITSDTQMTPTLWQKAKRNWRASWWKWKRRVKNAGLKQHLKNEDHGIWSHHFMANRWGKQCQTLFFWAPKSLQMVIAAMKLKDAYFFFFFFFNFFFRGKPDGVGRGGHAEARPRLGSAGPRPPRSPLDFLASSAALSAYFLEEELWPT